MSELEIMQRAKMYLDKMAQGIDPLTDRPVPDDDLINNVRISRCLFYTSEVLRQVIEQGGLNSKTLDVQNTSKGKASFYLSEESRAGFRYSNEKIPLSVFAREINSMIDEEKMYKLRAKSISTWLVDVGILKEIISEKGHSTKRPTKAGEEMGICTEMRVRDDLTYTMVLYSRQAQEFIMDHLDSVIEIDRIFTAQRAKKHESAEHQGQPWNQEQQELLIRLYKADYSIPEIASQLGRTRSGISARLKKLGLIEKRSKG